MHYRLYFVSENNEIEMTVELLPVSNELIKKCFFYCNRRGFPWEALDRPNIYQNCVPFLQHSIEFSFIIFFEFNFNKLLAYPLGYCSSWLWRNHRDRSDSVRARIRPRASVRVGRYPCRRNRHLATPFDCRPVVQRNSNTFRISINRIINILSSMLND